MPEIKSFWDEFWTGAEKQDQKQAEKFWFTPPPANVFFNDWVKSPLFPRQYQAVEKVFNPNFSEINSDVNEVILAWGKRGGKDLTISNLLNYIILWLSCCNNPQKELGLKVGEPIDIVNVSFDKEQAQSVFFEKFLRAIRATNNPTTGKNFYESMGMHIEKSILKDYVQFPKNIRCFSLNSVEGKSEGKNTIFAVFDEIGSFRFDKAAAIHKHIRTTARTTCLKYYKLFFISFLTSGTDYMSYIIDKAEKGGSKNVYFDRAATWDIRTAKGCPAALLPYVVKKENYQDDYDDDAVSAMLMYECKVPTHRANSFIKRAEKILACVNYERKDPRVDPEHLWVYDTDLKELELESWFKPFSTYEIHQLQRAYEMSPSEEIRTKLEIEKERHGSAEYFCHIDLSRGVVDCASIVLGHRYLILDKVKVYIDLILQIRARKDAEETKEIDMTHILDFVLKRLHKEFAFPLTKQSADGWNSALFLDTCRKENIEVEVISLDKDTAPYNTAKDLITQEDLQLYMFAPVIRELTELIVTDNKKIDHPSKSQWRLREEGINRGSKDCADGVAAIVYAAIKDSDNEPLGFAGK